MNSTKTAENLKLKTPTLVGIFDIDFLAVLESYTFMHKMGVCKCTEDIYPFIFQADEDEPVILRSYFVNYPPLPSK